MRRSNPGRSFEWFTIAVTVLVGMLTLGELHRTGAFGSERPLLARAAMPHR